MGASRLCCRCHKEAMPHKAASPSLSLTLESVITNLWSSRSPAWHSCLSTFTLQSQACFLTRGDLYVSWEKGRDTFDRLLVDADWSVNNGNWMWLSCSAFFAQYYRVYSPITFGKKYDKSGEYVRNFLPVLKVDACLPTCLQRLLLACLEARSRYWPCASLHSGESNLHQYRSGL